MKLNEKLLHYMTWGRTHGHRAAHLGELPALAPFTMLPCFVRDDREGQALLRGYEEAFFDAYLTGATGKTTKMVWEDRGREGQP